MEESSTEQHGCFVLRAGACAVPVYDSTRCTRRITNLKAWQVVSGTKIISDALQLEDGTGWVKVSQMVRLDVEYTGIRLYRTGDVSLARRYHPDHDARHESGEGVTGIVVTSCRVKGTNGTYFVRLDGNPSCWLPEIGADGKPLLHLVEETSVPVGASVAAPHPFADAYRGLSVWRVEHAPVAVYASWTRTGGSCGKLAPGTVISSVIRTLERGATSGSRRSVMIRLEDGSGWVCEQQEDGKGALRPVAVDYVRTRYRVNNGEVGLALRARPDHNLTFRRDPEVVINGTVWSYARVIGSTGDVYVRVEGKAGWLFETRDGQATLVKLQDTSSSGGAVSTTVQYQTARLNLENARPAGKEISCNEVSRVVSFSQGDMRVNVYYTTGTVGTCLDHPVQGKTQLFRREVSVGELDAIFKNPRVHLNKGCKRREHMPPLPPPAAMVGGRGGGGGGGGAASLSGGRGGAAAVQGEEAELKAQISRLEQAAREALEERNSLVWQLEVFRFTAEKEEAKRRAEDAKRKAEEEEEEQRRVRARLEDERKAKEDERKQREEEARKAALEDARRIPKSFYYSLGDCEDGFGGDLDPDEIKDLAITSDSYIIIYRNGTTAWSNIPKGLDNKLRGRQIWLPRPVHVALGPEDTGNYCVIFEDGDWSAVGPKDLYDAIRDGRNVSRVTLGPGDTWLVLYKDGTQAWSGGLPKGLWNQLNSRNPKLPKPVFVDLGPDDEWFVAYADGAWRADGYGRRVEDGINSAKKGGDVGRVWFGEEGTYVVAYRR